MAIPATHAVGARLLPGLTSACYCGILKRPRFTSAPLEVTEKQWAKYPKSPAPEHRQSGKANPGPHEPSSGCLVIGWLKA
jgi:hypothetical protein